MNASRPRAPAGARLAQGSQNRSLERGLEILRAFRPGTDLLGNGELAERTGLAPATVSRLTQTLVLGGFLQHDARARAYRLAPAVLSLGHAMRAASPVLKAATPLMREASGAYKLNVGLASADRAEMVGVVHNPIVAIVLCLLIINVCIHMRIGMNEVIEDYLEGDIHHLAKRANAVFAVLVAVVTVLSVAKIAFWG